MTFTVPPEPPDQSTTMTDLLREVQGFIDEANLAEGEPLYREGVHAAVMIVPEQSEISAKAWTLAITVRPYVLPPTALEGVSVILRGLDEDNNNVIFSGRLTRRGQLFFRDLPPAHYRASLRQRSGIVVADDSAPPLTARRWAAAPLAPSDSGAPPYLDIHTADGSIRGRVEIGVDDLGAEVLRLELVMADRTADGRFLRILWLPEPGSEAVDCLARMRWDDTMQSCHASVELASAASGIPLSVDGELLPPERLLDENDLVDFSPDQLRDAQRRDASPDGRQSWNEVLARLGFET